MPHHGKSHSSSSDTQTSSGRDRKEDHVIHINRRTNYPVTPKSPKGGWTKRRASEARPRKDGDARDQKHEHRPGSDPTLYPSAPRDVDFINLREMIIANAIVLFPRFVEASRQADPALAPEDAFVVVVIPSYDRNGDTVTKFGGFMSHLAYKAPATRDRPWSKHRKLIIAADRDDAVEAVRNLWIVSTIMLEHYESGVSTEIPDEFRMETHSGGMFDGQPFREMR